MTINKKIFEQLFDPPNPIGNFKNYQKIDNYIYISGQGPFDDNGKLIIGRIGEHFDVVEGYDIARRVGLTILSVLHESFGLDKIDRVVKLTGFINSVSKFTEHPKVMNGCSELMHECFGENGVHSRSAVGVFTLPNNIPVEIEGIFKLK